MTDNYKASVGVLVPAENRVIERDLRRGLNPSIAYHVGRIPFSLTTIDDTQAMLGKAVTVAPEIAAAGIDLLVFACTSGSLVGGPGYDSKVVAAISAAAGGVEATTTITEVVRSLRDKNAVSLSVFTPYPDDVNSTVNSFLSSEGFDVRELHGLGLLTGEGSVEPSEIAEWVTSKRSRKTDAIFISCTNFRGLEASELLPEMGIPVITSNGATIAGIHRRLDVKITEA